MNGLGFYLNASVYAYSTTHVSGGHVMSYTHPKLKADTFYVKTAVSRDGNFLACGSSENCVVLFPVAHVGANRQCQEAATLIRGHTKEVTGVAWTTEGNIVSGSDDLCVRTWREDQFQAQQLRELGEGEGKRWQHGWAE